MVEPEGFGPDLPWCTCLAYGPRDPPWHRCVDRSSRGSIVFYESSGFKVELLTVLHATEGTRDGCVTFPGGKYDPEEDGQSGGDHIDLLNAALREASEELGLPAVSRLDTGLFPLGDSAAEISRRWPFCDFGEETPLSSYQCCKTWYFLVPVSRDQLLLTLRVCFPTRGPREQLLIRGVSWSPYPLSTGLGQPFWLGQDGCLSPRSGLPWLSLPRHMCYAPFWRSCDATALGFTMESLSAEPSIRDCPRFRAHRTPERCINEPSLRRIW
jgi:8-oxo-dGTP pyrophosphatase MutT (NUDIX family)